MGQSKINQIEITWQQLFGDIPGIRNYCQNRVCIKREVIPIIFVPGIMGSRLKRKKDGKKIWDPDDAAFMVKNFGKFNVTAAQRKALVIGPKFDPDYAEVDNDNTVHNNNKFSSDSDATRAERGWGGIMWGSYGQFLIKLQTHTWPNPHDYCFEFPVHAFGYNWTDSCENSGRALKEYIDRTIKEHKKGVYSPDGLERECTCAILITHSMGGLVARSACVLHGASEQVLGVIHGVQPTTGSPAAYWRMKAGFERPKWCGPNKTWWDWLRSPLKMAKHVFSGIVSAWVLGTDGEEVTSLMGNMPGGLQLLPNKFYMDNENNREWLTYPSRNGEIKLPQECPYKDIYLLKNEAYRTVNPEWLDPGKEKSKMPTADDPWDIYNDYLIVSKAFHDKLQTRFHPDTYQFYVSGLDSPDKIVFTRKACIRRHRQPYSQYEPGFTNRGTFRTYVDENDRQISEDTKAATALVAMGMPEGRGDGTVPTSSGKALQLDLGLTDKPRTTEIVKSKPDDLFDMGHQNIFSCPKAQEIIFESVWHLVEKRIDGEIGVKKETIQ